MRLHTCALRNGRSWPGRQSAFGALRTWLDLQLARPGRVDTPKWQDGTVKRACTGPGSARSFYRLGHRLLSRLPRRSHPDCRAILDLIRRARFVVPIYDEGGLRLAANNFTRSGMRD